MTAIAPAAVDRPDPERSGVVLDIAEQVVRVTRLIQLQPGICIELYETPADRAPFAQIAVAAHLAGHRLVIGLEAR